MQSYLTPSFNTKNKLSKNQKVFVDCYGLTELRKVMGEKGWHVIRDPDTLIYDFKIAKGYKYLVNS